jgi:mannosyltransferase PIG-V
VTLSTMLSRSRRPSPPAPEARLSVRGHFIPDWAVLLAGYATSRAISLGILAAAYALGAGAGATVSNAAGGSGLFAYLQSWDGLHYRQIAEHGYPARLPIDGSGNVERNPWAFLPLYPLIVRALTAISGLDFSIAGVSVAVLFGGLATFALYRLLLRRLVQRSALWGALFFCFGPMSFLFDVAYADGMFLFLMFCSVIAMMSRRWILMIPFAVAASFAHPGAIALAPAVGIVCAVRLLRRDSDFRAREMISAGVAITAITLAGLAWPVIAGLVTGDPSAYFDTETAWWASYIGHWNFVPFSPWFVFANHFLGVAGVVLVLVGLSSFAYWLTRRSTRPFGQDLLVYTGSYVAYLVAVFLPQQSLLRMLLPLSPLLGHPWLSGSRLRRLLTLGACILVQPAAVLVLWVTWPP